MRARLIELLPRPLLLVVFSGLLGCAGMIGDVNPVLKAVVSDKPNKVRRAVETNQASINEINVCGAGALHLAIQNSNFEIVQILLEAGANPNIYSIAATEPSPCSDYFLVAVPSGFPPLHYAIFAARPRIAQLLFDAGADPMLTTSEGKTAIDIARDKIGLESLLAHMQAKVHRAPMDND